MKTETQENPLVNKGNLKKIWPLLNNKVLILATNYNKCVILSEILIVRKTEYKIFKNSLYYLNFSVI